ncbi:MAG: hypothetical protein JNK25_01850 [Phycisphaerae bacterium]|nr:hypothetical protein [Phycisphaerae bacterium]
MTPSIQSAFATTPGHAIGSGVRFARTEQTRSEPVLRPSSSMPGRSEAARAPRILRETDSAEIGAPQGDAPSTRSALIARVRALIAAGQYDTAERLEAAADTLIRVI